MTLCTECGREIKPIVAVDIDGTLAEYHLTLQRFACDYWDIPQPVATWGGLGNFEDHLGITQAQYREAKLAYRQGGYKRMAPAYPFAIQFMNWLNQLDVELWITTTRPWKIGRASCRERVSPRV